MLIREITRDFGAIPAETGREREKEERADCMSFFSPSRVNKRSARKMRPTTSSGKREATGITVRPVK